LAACSWIGVRPSSPIQAVECTRSNALPIVDTVPASLAGLVAVAGVTVAIACTGTIGGDSCRGDAGYILASSAVPAAIAVLYGLSARYGYHAVAQCRRNADQSTEAVATSAVEVEGQGVTAATREEPPRSSPHGVYVEGSGWGLYRSHFHYSGQLAVGYVRSWSEPGSEIGPQLRLGATLEEYDAGSARARAGFELEPSWRLPQVPLRLGARIAVGHGLDGGPDALTFGIRVRLRYVSLGFDFVHDLGALTLPGGATVDSGSYAGVGLGLTWEPTWSSVNTGLML
jgi:hypothetical protein